MLASFLQILALVGLPVGGFVHSPGVVCLSVSVGFVGLALEKHGGS